MCRQWTGTWLSRREAQGSIPPTCLNGRDLWKLDAKEQCPWTAPQGMTPKDRHYRFYGSAQQVHGLFPPGYEFHSDYPFAFSLILNFSALPKAAASKREVEWMGSLQWEEQGALRMVDSDGKQSFPKWRHSHWRNDREAQEGMRCLATYVFTLPNA